MRVCERERERGGGDGEWNGERGDEERNGERERDG